MRIYKINRPLLIWAATSSPSWSNVVAEPAFIPTKRLNVQHTFRLVLCSHATLLNTFLNLKIGLLVSTSFSYSYANMWKVFERIHYSVICSNTNTLRYPDRMYCTVTASGGAPGLGVVTLPDIVTRNREVDQPCQLLNGALYFPGIWDRSLLQCRHLQRDAAAYCGPCLPRPGGQISLQRTLDSRKVYSTQCST
jgi:hypothetical protein